MSDRYDDRDRGYDDRDRGRYDDRGYDDRDRGRYDDREPEKKKKKGPLIALGVAAVVLALVAGIVVSGVLGGDDEPTASGEILLEPTSFSGDDPFSAEAFGTEEQSCVPPGGPEVPDGQGPPICEDTPPAGTPPPPQSTGGGVPGLYGGTGDKARCDPAQMVAFLAANPDKAQAWVDALNADPNLNWDRGTLTVADIPLYIGELTSLVLVSDTRVTNHGFVDGKANPISSVLQAGSAVLVDKYGVPRVKCYCGNPLLPADPGAGTVFKGTPWPGFDPAKTVVVTPTPQPVTNFVVVNPNGGPNITVNVGIEINVNTTPTTTTTTVPGQTTAPTTAGPTTAPPTTAAPTTAPPTTAPPTTAGPCVFGQGPGAGNGPVSFTVKNDSPDLRELVIRDSAGCINPDQFTLNPGQSRQFTLEDGWTVDAYQGPDLKSTIPVQPGINGQTITLT